MPNDPSPLSTITWVSGLATFAPSPNGTATPMQPFGPAFTPVARRMGWHRLAREVQDLVAVDHDNRVAVHELSHLVAQSQRVNGRLVGVEQLLGLLARLEVVAAQCFDPSAHAPGAERVTTHLAELPQDRLGVADDSDVDRAIAADLLVGDVDLDHLRVLGKARGQTEADDEVHAGAHDQDDVGVLPRPAARAEEAERVVFGDHAPALGSGVERNAGELDELPKLVHGVRPEHTTPGHHDRPLGRGQ